MTSQPELSVALTTWLNAVHFRGLRLANLRWLVAASALVWIQADGPRIPGLAWVAFLTEAGLLVLVAAYAFEEQIWARRVISLPAESGVASIHVVWNWRDELRSGIWYGAGVCSLPPWICAGIGRALPPSLLLPLTGLYMALVATAVAIELMSRARHGAPEVFGRELWPAATDYVRRTDKLRRGSGAP